jgi:Protein of unknown function DUF262
MTTFDITDLRHSTIWSLYRMRERLQLDPDYQRLSDIWTPDKRKLLLDTVLNDFDVPKLYLHKFLGSKTIGGKQYDYAIIDGKQRLESLWNFIDGKIALDDDFDFFKDPKVKAHGMKYAELGNAYPDLKVQFDGYPLTVVVIETEDIEIIEEMFSRLNEAAPLTAAEKRNAFGGPLPVAIRRLAKLPIFVEAIPFPNKRYRHFDLAAKFLLAQREDKVTDTKKIYLDRFVKEYSEEPRSKTLKFVKDTSEVLALMKAVFVKNDTLLRQVGMILLYYHLFRLARKDGWESEITRQKLLNFEKLRDANRKKAEQDLANADYDLIEFDKYTQSPNDGYAIRFRLAIMLNRIFKKKVSIEDL